MARYEEIDNINNHYYLVKHLETAENLMGDDSAAAVIAMRKAMELMLRLWSPEK